MANGVFDVELKVGTIEKAQEFPEAEKPEMAKLWIDIGDETFQSAAQTGYNYSPEKLEGRQVLCATDLGEVRIAGFKSEVLTVGVPDEDGNPVLVRPDREVPEGGELY